MARLSISSSFSKELLLGFLRDPSMLQGELMQVHTTALLLDQSYGLWTQQEVEVDCFQSLFSLTWLNRFVQTLKGFDVVFFKGFQKFPSSDISLAWTNSSIAFSPCAT